MMGGFRLTPDPPSSLMCDSMAASDFSLKEVLAQNRSPNGEEKIELAVIMPAYNEQENIGSVVDEWIEAFRAAKIRFVYLAIDDGSKDQTWCAIQKLEERYPELIGWSKSNDGHGISCRRGYEQALGTNAPWIFQIDSDGQCDPAYFAAMWKARQEADVLYGVRKSRDDGLGRTLTSLGCRIGTFLWTGAYLRDPNVPYRLIRADALRKAMERVPASFNLYNVALSLALKRDASLRWRHFPIHFRKRPHGEGYLNIFGVVRTGLSMLTDLKKVR